MGGRPIREPINQAWVYTLSPLKPSLEGLVFRVCVSATPRRSGMKTRVLPGVIEY